MKATKKNILLLLQIATICVFLGRSYQHLFWDAPFRSLLWSEEFMSGIVSFFTDMTWSEYVRSPETDKSIQLLIRTQGFFYLLCAFIALFIQKVPLWIKRILLLGAASLIFLAFLYMKEKWFHFGQFFEYSLQAGSPIFLYFLATKETLPNKKLLNILKIAIAVTFVCHGLYALNYYPRPGNFVQMVISILRVGEETAIQFLNIAGFLDFVIAIGIFMPRKVAIPVLLYATFWGFATSIARVWANFYFEFPVESLHQWGWETIVRFPHFLLVVVAILMSNSLDKRNN